MVKKRSMFFFCFFFRNTFCNNEKHHIIFFSEMWKLVQWRHRAFFGGSRMQHCTHFQPYRTAGHSLRVFRTFYMSSWGTAVELAFKHTVHNSINVSYYSTPVYYLRWVCNAKSESVRATITSGRESPQESDFPAAATAARSSLLSTPITGASVPT